MPSISRSDKLDPQYLIALHSCTEALGVGVLNLLDPSLSTRTETFPLGKELSNKVFICIEKLLPQRKWKNIVRISVATGPGSFTGTRLTITMARTIAQQLGCSVDAISSFKLMAFRVIKNLDINNQKKPFWITNHLKGRGIVAGKYQLKQDAKSISVEQILELNPPALLSNTSILIPSFKAFDNVQDDLLELLNFSYSSQIKGIKRHWKEALPIYPTSPVDNE